MAIQDKTLTIIGSQAKVTSVMIRPIDASSYEVSVSGSSVDGSGNVVDLDPFHVVILVGQVTAIDNLVAVALTKLRQSNGLEV